MPYEPAMVEELLRKLNPGEVLRDPMLAPLTSYKIGGPADFLVYPRSEAALGDLLAALDEIGVKPFVLGNGSNLLVSDLGFRGIVVTVKKLRTEIELDGDLLRVGAGATIWDLTPFAVEHSLPGFEPISGIPGSVGGALTMNAGAFDGNISDRLLRIDALEADGTRQWIPKESVNFGYRSAPELQGKIILGAEFDSQDRGDKILIKAKVDNILSRRGAKQPTEYPSCGSVFKRPEGHYAGKLIQDAGLKGFTIGGARVSEKHANFIINLGKATAADVMGIINEAKRRIFENSGVRMTTEVRFLGDFSYIEN